MRLYKGTYSLSEAGGSTKVTIPSDIIRTWDLKVKDQVHVYFENGYVIISPKKLKDDEEQ